MPEEVFVPGLDPGLKFWLRMRQELRDVRTSGLDVEMTVPRIRYRYKQYWLNKLPDRIDMDSLLSHEDPKGDFSNWQAAVADFKERLLIAKRNIALGNMHEYALLVNHAMSQRHENHLVYILECGLGLNRAFGPRQWTLLHAATFRGDLQKVRLLLAQGAHPDIRDSEGNACLHYAVNHPPEFHPPELMEALLDAGANIDARNHKRMTPLHLCTVAGYPDVAEQLLRRGANPLARDRSKNKRMPIEYCYKDKRPQWLDLFARNARFFGQWRMSAMQARILAHHFTAELFREVEQPCLVCKKKKLKCERIKKENYRRWVLLHNKVPQNGYVEPKKKIS
jgi:hypothetical protein